MDDGFPIRFHFLGTGTSQGVPVIGCTCRSCLSEDPHDNRLRSSLLVETEELAFCIDAGPDFRQQMLREKVKKLDAVLFTHAHKDHTGGLDDVRAFNFIQGRAMDIYAEERVLLQLKNEFAYIFAEPKYPGIPELNLHRIENRPFRIGSLEIIPIRAFHYHLPVFGYRIGKVSYITDANEIPPEEMEKMKGTEILIINALRKRQHISHFTLEEAIAIGQRIQARQTYLTHISHQMGPAEEIRKELPENVFLAYDGLQMEA